MQVAAAFSEDKARQGGDLGWKSRVRIQQCMTFIRGP